MDDTHSLISIYTVLSVVAGLVRIAGSLAIVVIVFGAVRRHRPDAWQGLGAWAVTSIALEVFWTIAWWVWPTFATDTASMLKGQMIFAVLGMVTGVVLVVLLIRGLVAIAQPPKPLPPVDSPPYR